LSGRAIARAAPTRDDVAMGLPLAHATPSVSVVFGVIQVGLAVAYIWAASQPSPRGNRWPFSRTLSWIAGLVLLSVVMEPPVASHDETLWVHSAQHLVVMMAVPPLLVLGSPITLLLRSVSPRARREIVGILHDPAMKPFSGPVAGVGLTLEYHGTMFLVMLTGVYGFTLHHEWAHVATHFYLFLCGLLFWMPLAGRDPTGFRPPYRAKIAMVGAGIPAYVLLGLLMSGRDETAAWVLGAGGVALTLAGLGLLVAQRAGRRTGSGLRLPASQRRMFAMRRAMSTQQAMDPDPER
jgi:cytochrome c oxidase assembly factor CtaG